VLTKDEIELTKNLLSRDISMFHIAKYYIERAIKNDKCAAIVAHSGHIGKTCSESIFPFSKTMGYFLNCEFNEKYYAFTILVGDGIISSRNSGIIGKEEVTNLGTPISGSIEKTCTSIEVPFFFLSTEHLPDEHFYYRAIGQSYLGYDCYNYGKFRKIFDGLIFKDS